MASPESSQTLRVRGIGAAGSTKLTHHGLAIAAAAVPRGVICLLSALQFHGIGVQQPFQVWMALDRRAWRPRLAQPPLRIVRFTGRSLTEGLERHKVEGRVIRVYGVAKTLSDCFKYRNRCGTRGAPRGLETQAVHHG